MVYLDDGPVVPEAVFATEDDEAEDVFLVIKNLKPLDASGCGKTGDHGDLTDTSDGGSVSVDHSAALDEVFVPSWIRETSEYRPNGAHRSGYLLDDQRPACRFRLIVCVVGLD